MSYRFLSPFPILPWPPALWRKKDVSEFVSLLATLVTAVATFTVALVDDRNKLPLLVTIMAAGIVALYAKASASRLEKIDKDQKELDARIEREKNSLDTVGRAARICDAILESIHRGHFIPDGEEETHKTRVTLFICKESDANTGQRKHLAIFARHGVHKSSTTTWALDSDHPDGCRGLAGKVWYHGTFNIKWAECDWPTDDSKEDDKKRYASSHEITVEEAKKLKVKSRAIAAAPVMVHGRKWGVLVLDSLTGYAIPPPGSQKTKEGKEFKSMFNRYAELIGLVLGESGL
jgi:hypothetical protein